MSALPFELSESKRKLLHTNGHILALGGPGSGKTTIALFKAKHIIAGGLKKFQQVLFLSFARATIARVDQQAKVIVTPAIRKQLEISTYHGFSWTLLKSHGYLLNKGAPLKLLPPPEAASRLADIAKDQREDEKYRLFRNDGLLHFDLFAGLSADLLAGSQSLATIIGNAYPVIILDEFQDTNADEWRLIQELGKRCTLISLADLEQRIYEFRGADPARVSEFIERFKPTEFDFGMENNRSNGTDIVQFGNDLLTGKNKRTAYNDVHVKGYPIRNGTGAHLTLKTEVLQAMKRLIKSGQSNWSIGLLVPSKKLMLTVSDFLSARQKLVGKGYLPELTHEVALEMSGPSLAAVMISRLMEKGLTNLELQHSLLNNLCEHIRGRNGNDPTSQTHLNLTYSLKEFISTGRIRGSVRELVVSEALRISSACRTLKFSGDPAEDWLMIRKLLEESPCETIKQVGIDARYLRLLRKGAILNSGLSTLWRTKGNYEGAYGIVRSALAQEHFAASLTVWKGIHVMTIHKAKGKEFDEVIVYEGMYNGRIVWAEPRTKQFEQSRLALRVSVTRAMKRATIISPETNMCPFL